MRRPTKPKPNLKVVKSSPAPDMPMVQRLELLQDEWMTAAEEGRVIANVREIAAAVNLVLRIELVLAAHRKEHARRPSTGTGSAVRKYAGNFEAAEERARRDDDRQGSGSAADDDDYAGDAAAGEWDAGPAAG